MQSKAPREYDGMPQTPTILYILFVCQLSTDLAIMSVALPYSYPIAELCKKLVAHTDIDSSTLQ